MNTSDTAAIKLKSLAKATEVLNCFIERPEWGVTELGEKLRLNKSNVHNILSTYRALGYLEQDASTGKYQLGLRIFDLSRALGDRFSVRRVARPFLQEIANQTNQRVYLAVPRDDEVLYLEAAYPADDFSLFRSLMGVRARMYCTAIGKAMMACLPQAIAHEYATRPLSAYTENTITDSAHLLAELAVVRENGFAVDNMEHEYGIKCVGVPILSREGAVVAAISVSGPMSPQFDEQGILKIAELLKTHVNKIQERI